MARKKRSRFRLLTGGVHEHRRRSAFPYRSGQERGVNPALQLRRAREPLARCSCLRLSVNDRGGVLVAVSLLVGCGRRWWSDGQILASLAGPDFCGIAPLDV